MCVCVCVVHWMGSQLMGFESAHMHVRREVITWCIACLRLKW